MMLASIGTGIASHAAMFIDIVRRGDGVWMAMAAWLLCMMNTYLQRICHRPF
jgi:hypothetical protein